MLELLVIPPAFEGGKSASQMAVMGDDSSHAGTVKRGVSHFENGEGGS